MELHKHIIVLSLPYSLILRYSEDRGIIDSNVM